MVNAASLVNTRADIILTGLPRSGLTLAGALVDSFENSICLNEPISHLAMVPAMLGNPLELSKWVVGEFHYVRSCINRQVPIADIRAEGGLALLDSIFDSRNPATGDDLHRGHVMAHWPNIPAGFPLAMKHHAIYTAILPQLVEMDHFNIIAIIRNPIDTILSWQKLKNHSLNSGTLPPDLYPYWPQTGQIVWAEQDVLTRMVQLYDLFCEQYHSQREHITIIRYEDMLQDPSLISAAIGRAGTPPAAGFIERPQASRSAKQVDPIRERLRQYSVFAKQFYPDF